MPGEMREDFEDAIEELELQEGKPAARTDDGGALEDRGPFDGKPTGETAPKIDSQDTLSADGKPEKVETAAEVVPTATVKAPASWSATEREEWKNLTPQAKAAVIRRERQVDEALRTSAQSREFVNKFEQLIQPYQHYIASEGSDPLTAVQNMFRTAGVLNGAPPGQKAQEVARMIVHFGVDLQMLDQYLAAHIQGKQVPQSPQDMVLQHIDSRLKPVMDFMGQVQSTRTQSEQRLVQEVQNEWQQFSSDEKNEFAEELREDIADILDVATRRGVQMDLQTAYARATMLHPTISKIIDQRKQVGGAAQQTAAARRARQAAASISSDAPSRGDGGGSETSSLREDLQAAMASSRR